MIKKVKAVKEIVIISENRVGVLSAISKILADRGINIVAISAHAACGVALINLVTEDHARVKDLLDRKAIAYQENSVLLLEVEDKPGTLLSLTKKLAANKVDILNVYGSAGCACCPCSLVILTDNNRRAEVALRGK